MKKERKIATVESIGYSLTGRLIVSLKERSYAHFIKPSEIHYGGKNCEVNTIEVGSKIEFDKDVHPAIRELHNVVVLSNRTKEVDTDGNLIRW